MKKLLLILLCLPMIGFGQMWTYSKIINEDENGFFVEQDPNGSYIICSTIEDSINSSISTLHIWIIKLNQQGDTIWTSLNQIPSISGFGTNCIGLINTYANRTLDGGFIMSVNCDQGYGATFKTDSLGIYKWVQEWGSTYGQETTNGGYIFRKRSFFGGVLDDVVKTDHNGNVIWAIDIGNTDINGRPIQQTSDGGFILLHTDDPPYINKLIKLDNIGNITWSQDLLDTNLYVLSVCQTSDNGYAILSTTDYDDPAPFGAIDHLITLVKTDSIGNQQWSHNYRVPSITLGALGVINLSTYSEVFQQTSDGGYIISGSSSYNIFSQVHHSTLLIKTNSHGDTTWTRDFGFGFAADVKRTSDGGYIITGGASSNISQKNDVFLIKLNDNGNITSTFNITRPSSDRKLEKIVDILGRETKGTKNEPLFYIYDDGTVEKRIIIE